MYFSSFACPARSLVSPFWDDFFFFFFFCVCDRFYPNVEVVAFCLRGLCMLGVCFGCWHSSVYFQDLLSPCDGKRARTTPRFIFSSERLIPSGVRTYVDSKGTISSTGRLRGGSSPRAASRKTVSSTHYQPSC